MCSQQMCLVSHMILVTYTGNTINTGPTYYWCSRQATTGKTTREPHFVLERITFATIVFSIIAVRIGSSLLLSMSLSLSISSSLSTLVSLSWLTSSFWLRIKHEVSCCVSIFVTHFCIERQREKIFHMNMISSPPHHLFFVSNLIFVCVS